MRPLSCPPAASNLQPIHDLMVAEPQKTSPPSRWALQRSASRAAFFAILFLSKKHQISAVRGMKVLKISRGPKVTRSLPNQSYDESIAIHSTRGFCSPGELIHRLPHHPSLSPHPEGKTHRSVQVATTLWLRHHSECLTSQDRSRTLCQYKKQRPRHLGRASGS